MEPQSSEDEFSVLFSDLDMVVSKGSSYVSLEKWNLEELFVEWFWRRYSIYV